jgi:hypothetical protein
MINAASVAVAAAAIFLSLFPITDAQRVESCSFPGVTCRTCLGRFESQLTWKKSSRQCGWCGSKTTNTSDPTATNGYCISNNFLDKNLRQQLCNVPGDIYVVSETSAGCDFSLSEEAVAGIVIGVLSGVSAIVCYSQSKKLGASSLDQKKWLLAGLVLPVVSVVVLNVLARRGHFAKKRVAVPAHVTDAREQNSASYAENPTAGSQPLSYGAHPNEPAPVAYSTQQYLSPNPYSPNDLPQPYVGTSSDYSNAGTSSGQQQGYGYPSQGYSNAPPPYSNVARV